MQVAGPDALRLVHRAQGLVREQNRTCEPFWVLEERGRKLEQLHLEHDLVDPAAAFLADTEAAHQ